MGLLNNGAEDTKGDPLHREAHQLLKRAGEQGTIHFVGNVEARDVPFGAADVIAAGRASPATSCSRPWRARPCSCPA